MTAQLARLRIAGFKSFAEPVSLDILPGLTGIVGPNGCGKSNVVEALRWAMGETSARSLRGGEMDDVIFDGTTARASRNLAEVTITLNGALPDPWQNEAELQVTRRIERGAGSAFRANGRELRARDVQTLYADLASGARSSGMVSQGRVAALVNAKPEERRQVLEEAAGITGLHARRHEAELKLRAAEANLSRADDLRTQIEGAQEGMRRQARQAARYRNISALVRAAETEHLAVLLAAARAQAEQAEAAHGDAGAAATKARLEAESAEAALDAAEAALPALRGRLADAARVLERRRMAAEGQAEEAERAAKDVAEAERRLLELEADLSVAEKGRADADASVTRLAGETERLQQRSNALPGKAGEAEAACHLAETRANAALFASDAADQAALEASLASAQAKTIHAAATQRLEAARAVHLHEAGEQVAAEAALVAPDLLAMAEAEVAGAGEMLAAARERLELADQARNAAAQAHAELRMAASQAEAAHAAAAQHRNAAAQRLQRLTQALDAAQQALDALGARRVAAEKLADAHAKSESALAMSASSARNLADCERAASAAGQHAAEAARAQADLFAATSRAQAALADAEARALRVGSECAGALSALQQAEAAAPDTAALAASAGALADAQAALAESKAGLQAAQEISRQTEAEAASARQSSNTTRAEAAQHAGAAAGLAQALPESQDGGPGSVLAALIVSADLELALGAALGGAAGDTLDGTADRYWRCLPPETMPPALPDSAVALADFVRAPAALQRALAFVALLPDTADGDAIQAKLPPGTVAVTRQGACWRWDGHVTRAGAPNPAALLLAQRRRLAEARTASEAAQARADDASHRLDAATAQAASAMAAAERAGAAQEEAALLVREAADRHQRAASKATLWETQQAALRPAADRLLAEQADADSLANQARQAVDALPDVAALAEAADAADALARSSRAALEAARAEQQATRSSLEAARDHAASLDRQAAEIAARIAASGPALDDLAAETARAEAILAEAEASLAGLPDLAGVRATLRDAASAETAARDGEVQARAARTSAEAGLASARDSLAALRVRHSETASHQAAQAGLLARAEADLLQAERDLRQAQAGLTALADASALSDAAQAARVALDAARLDKQSAQAQFGALQAELGQIRLALEVARGELTAWQDRHQEADARAQTLAGRAGTARRTWQERATAPAEAARRAEASATALVSAEADHTEAAQRLDTAEQRAREAALAHRDGEQRAGACRETALRAEATRQATLGAMQAVLARAADRLGADATLPVAADASDTAEERARRRFERLSREREEMGPVNLRAELELAELDERVATLAREREELGTAIAKLRGAIGHLNREGRARLTAVFTEVDQHFRTLFTRMMGGGQAHLALTGSDDPLLAGLEIYAEPPGKKLVSLSLLSGGEQALTALSLIFAVFRCTPAPISVLDEVDAPLDDANVERFCTLLDDVVRDTGTRFLVVTHHQLTMSRMDRLFGVTMQERGVSRLLSVDLRSAVAMVEPVMQAAE